MKTRHQFFYWAVSICLIAIFTFSCSTNPVTGKKQVSLMSEAQEIQLGAESDPAIVAQFGLYQNDEMQRFIEEKGQEMAAISHRPHLKFQFKILDSPVVNAFAVPGGYVYFTRGIMAHFNNEAEFAGVLGHEIGHVTARHSAQQYSKQTLAQVLFIGGLIVSKEFRSFADVAQQSMALLFLKFSRNNESESDQLGVEYSTKVNYDAREMADFFGTLKKLGEESGSNEIPTFMSTHPDPADRKNKVKKMATEMQAKSPGKSFAINRDSYLRMIDGLIYGEDPRQGYVENNVFYHPELKFQYPIPANWQTMNSPQQVQMASRDGKAMMILTLSGEQTLDAGAQALIEQYKLTVQSSRNTNVNGLPALEMISDQVTQDPNTGQESRIRIQTYLINYNSLIYVIHGLGATLADFNLHKGNFDRTMKGFSKLTDPSKINVKPELISIKAAPGNGSLSQALTALGVNSSRHGELSILNGMELSDPVEAGQLLKVIEK